MAKPKHGKKAEIPEPVSPPPETVKFSFRYLDSTNPKFTFNHSAKLDAYIEKFFGRMKDVGCLTINDFKFNGSAALRCHSILWKDTTEKSGFTTLNKQLRDLQPWQFGISANQHGRIHGFFIDSTFYIVWFDPKHQLYK